MKSSRCRPSPVISSTSKQSCSPSSPRRTGSWRRKRHNLPHPDTVDRPVTFPRFLTAANIQERSGGDFHHGLLAHNHPNGNLTPSEHDTVLTRAIVLAAETVQIKVVDHLIVSAQDTFSFRKAGLL